MPFTMPPTPQPMPPAFDPAAYALPTQPTAMNYLAMMRSAGRPVTPPWQPMVGTGGDPIAQPPWGADGRHRRREHGQPQPKSIALTTTPALSPGYFGNPNGPIIPPQISNWLRNMAGGFVSGRVGGAIGRFAAETDPVTVTGSVPRLLQTNRQPAAGTVGGAAGAGVGTHFDYATGTYVPNVNVIGDPGSGPDAQNFGGVTNAWSPDERTLAASTDPTTGASLVSPFQRGFVGDALHPFSGNIHDPTGTFAQQDWATFARNMATMNRGRRG